MIGPATSQPTTAIVSPAGAAISRRARNTRRPSTVAGEAFASPRHSGVLSQPTYVRTIPER